MIQPKGKADVETFTLMVAKKQGWALSSDRSFYEDLVAGLEKNWNRYGYFLCPCRDTDGSRSADADIICPCEYAKEDITEFGHCYCSLYTSQEFLDSHKKSDGIPERRNPL